jgi:hypothetical protein
MNLFDEKTYKEFLSRKKVVHNSCIREEGQDFWDAMLSEEAQIKDEELIKTIQSLGE